MDIKQSTKDHAQREMLRRVDWVMELVNTKANEYPTRVVEIAKDAEKLREEINQLFERVFTYSDCLEYISKNIGLIAKINRFCTSSLGEVDIGLPADKPVFDYKTSISEYFTGP